jgi:hypothetical protein
MLGKHQTRMLWKYADKATNRIQFSDTKPEGDVRIIRSPESAPESKKRPTREPEMDAVFGEDKED